MSRSDELDLLSTDTQSILADTTIVIMQNRPVSTANPDTRSRSTDAGAQNPTVAAVEQDATPQYHNGKWVRTRRWTVLVDAVGFRPSRQGMVQDADGNSWRIVGVDLENNGREYAITGEDTD